MKFAALILIAAAHSASAFQPLQPRSVVPSTVLNGYLDELGAIGPPEEVEEDDSRDATKLSKEKLDRFGVGSWEGFVDFNEFDGGDGQMGVAGDGNTKLDKFDMTEMAKSKSMSAKNAWGRSTGYAETLINQGVEQSRAQQLENWHNQQEVLQRRKQQRYLTDEFDSNDKEDENWRNLAKFGVERTQVRE